MNPETKTHSTGATNSLQASSVQACQNCKNDFTIEPDDFLFYEKIKVPPPTFCPQCRMQRRAVFRNQNKLFRNKSSVSGQNILALVPMESSIKVVTQEEWFSDDWDPIDSGMEIDFSRPFLSQLMDLHFKIPQYNLNVARMVNSPYSGNAEDLKNCYMIFNATSSEDCVYGTGYYFSKNCLDNCDIYNSELCSNSFWLEKCSRVHFSEECKECIEVYFSKNCANCMYCVGCVNLRNKSYCIENIQYTKEEYYKKLQEFGFDKYSNLIKYKNFILDFWNKFPKKYLQGVMNLNSSGVYVTESKNVKDSYIVKGGENLKYVQFINEAPNKDSMDITVWGTNSELAYEYSACGSGIYNSKFLVDCWPDVRNSEYSLHCRSSNALFGCVGLSKKEYCIFNKQYTKDEYFEMVDKIKKHMNQMPYIDKKGLIYKYGEFFPIEFSWYGYNNTLAQELLPLTKEEALEQHYAWYEVQQTNYVATMNSVDLPDSILDTPDDIVSEVIQCDCSKKYKIIPQELILLKSIKIPIPRTCPDCRYQEKINRRLKPVLYKMKCMKNECSNVFETGYDPKDDHVVYCEKCYQQEVY